MTTVLSPSPFQKYFDNNGLPAVGYKLFTYAAGTTTKLATYTDSTGGATNTNPIILDARGECNLWIPPNVAYKYVLTYPTDTDPPTNAIKTEDNIVSSQLVTLYGGVDAGSANSYILNFTANFTTYQDGIIIYWVPSHSNTTSSVVNVNGLGNVSILNPDGSQTFSANTISANTFLGMIYKGGSFYILNPTYAAGSFTATLTGMTGVTTGTINYSINNGICTLYTYSSIFQGTSNSTAMTMTGLPAAVMPSISNGTYFTCFLQDNGSDKFGNGIIKPFPSNQIVFGLMTVSGANMSGGGAFTNSGPKGLSSTAFWSVSYKL